MKYLTGLLSVLVFASSAYASGTRKVIGNIDGITRDSSGHSILSGWACQTGTTQSISVNVYARSAYPGGTFVTSAIANQTSESGVVKACGVTSGQFRFHINIEPFLQAHSGQLIYVYGINTDHVHNLPLSGAGLFQFGTQFQNRTGMQVGAIRWDAWVGQATTVGKAVDKTLSPLQFHDRIPFYAQDLSSSSVIVNGLSQSTMDQEIAYARKAGLSYWAFDYYPDGSGLEGARKLYLSSSRKSWINYSLVLNVNPNPTVAQLVAMFADPSYQKVLNGRPLLYFFNSVGMTTLVPQLRSAAASAGVADPYIVLMGNLGDAIASGADAVSAYGAYGSGEAYTTLAAREVTNWTKTSADGAQVVPWISAGWDPRPRILNPVSWGATYPSTDWVQQALPSEVASHVKDALTWLGGKPGGANVALIYAWNEFDEGGWICPTMHGGTDRIDAIASVLGAAP